MTRIAEAMREWKERGIAPFPSPAFTQVEAARLMRLEEAEQKVRALCLPDDARTVLTAAPADDGSTRRADVLDSAMRLVAAGFPAWEVVSMLNRGYGPVLLENALIVPRLRMDHARVCRCGETTDSNVCPRCGGFTLLRQAQWEAEYLGSFPPRTPDDA